MIEFGNVYCRRYSCAFVVFKNRMSVMNKKSRVEKLTIYSSTTQASTSSQRDCPARHAYDACYPTKVCVVE